MSCNIASIYVVFVPRKKHKIVKATHWQERDKEFTEILNKHIVAFLLHVKIKLRT